MWLVWSQQYLEDKALATRDLQDIRVALLLPALPIRIRTPPQKKKIKIKQ